ncbi:MAG: hypothetical protein AAGF59_06065 [Pseudomonadota bacterium]
MPSFQDLVTVMVSLPRHFFNVSIPAIVAGLSLAFFVAFPSSAQGQNQTGFSAGGFTFSDELGGFTIGRVTGSGSQADPIVIEQTLDAVEPVILVIRYDAVKSTSSPRIGGGRWIAVHLKLVVQNRSRRVWQGFEIELQEILNQPSVRQDGLSFDQGSLISSARIHSNRFSASQRLFEPYDRIIFREGHVNPADFVQFRLHITDPTPVKTFYLLLNPEILFSAAPNGKRPSAG